MTKTNSRRKGITGEKEVARMFRRWFPECKRSFGQSRKGHEVPDLVGGIESEFFVEVKLWAKTCGTPKHLSDAWNKLIEDMHKLQAKPFYRLDTRYENRDDWPIEPIMVYRLTGCIPKMDWHVALLLLQYPVFRQYSLNIITPGVVAVPWKVFAEHLDSVMEVCE